jgi:hypothetical protein
VDLPDYGVRYARSRHALVPHLLLQVPRILFRLATEQPQTEALVRRFGADAVVSDNRYGCFSKRVPSFLITHQLRFQLPRPIRWSAFISEGFNARCFARFDAVFVPDRAGTPNLSGDLSHRGAISRHPKLRYLGPLSSLRGRDGAAGRDRLDTLILVSGPEPSRTALERVILAQAPGLGGRTAVVLGRPEQASGRGPVRRNGLTLYPHLDRDRLSGLMRSASVVVANSGYSTIMELAAFGKKALLIPTPGQTEQEYLARHARESGLFYSVPQEGLDLGAALAETAEFYRRVAPPGGFGTNGIRGALDLIAEYGVPG